MTIAFNKPYGVLCQFTPDQPGQRTLADFHLPPNVYPLGRLDMDSEGLLILSDQKGLNAKLLTPENAHPRTYLVQVEGIPEPGALHQLKSGGLVIKGHKCLPCRAEVLPTAPPVLQRVPPIRVRKTIPDSWIAMTLIEGKNRQVRRMTAAIGHPTLRLIRTKIGELSFPDLASGTFLELDSAHLDRLLRIQTLPHLPR